MPKVFNYTKITSKYYLDYTDELEEDGIDFDYEVDNSDLLDALSELFADEYFNGIDKEHIKSFIEDFDLLNLLVEKCEEELREFFREDAFYNYEG